MKRRNTNKNGQIDGKMLFVMLQLSDWQYFVTERVKRKETIGKGRRKNVLLTQPE